MTSEDVLFYVVLFAAIWLIAKVKAKYKEKSEDTGYKERPGFVDPKDGEWKVRPSAGDKTTVATSVEYQRIRPVSAAREELLLNRWKADHILFGTYHSSRGDRINRWQDDYYDSSKIGYAASPAPAKSAVHVSVFAKHHLSTGRDHAHLTDIQAFRAGTKLSVESRLGPSYPVEKPVDEFPSKPGRPTRPHFHDKEEDFDNAWEWAQRLHGDRVAFWERERSTYTDAYSKVVSAWEGDKHRWDASEERDVRKLDTLRGAYAAQPDTVAQYMKTMLDCEILLPSWCPSDTTVEFSQDDGILLAEITMPDVSTLEVFKNRQLKAGTKVVPATASEAREFRNWIFHFLPIRFLWGAWKLDTEGFVDLFCVNGVVDHTDRATGQRRTDTVLSVTAKREQLESLVIEAIDPLECFKSLKGMAGADVSSIIPVAPLIQFDKDDGRFVDGRDVIEDVAETNLAAMDWEDFEHLVRELLEREFGEGGAEVKITQASRDKGVDAVIFDPDPIRGGKIVVQAKRYTNVVDVSAVRDLYGTVMNEGAMKGILVTTSNYGGDSYDFAKDKPITLMNGSNLLHLLEKHGYRAKIDLAEAKKLLS